ncbi:MAG: hypothetical protein EAZ89_13785 [Bacteroidetes bacterium]|nr:MAG: hypothetical protein EAZ89_13785 [Bacteroidota bacterium]
MTTTIGNWGKVVIILLFIAPLAFYFGARTFTHPIFKPFPYAYTVTESGDSVKRRMPAFQFVTLDGDTLTNADLSGKICYYHLFSLQDTLALKIAQFHLKSFYDNLEWEKYDGIRLISISTGGDSLSALKAFAENRGVDSRRWMVVTADAPTLLSIGESLRLPEFAGKTLDNIPHRSDSIALADKEGWVRKYYAALDFGSIKKFSEDFRSFVILEYPEDIGRRKP